MDLKQKDEVWQRGPIKNVITLLQPVAHALLQAQEEIEIIMHDFLPELLWQKPCGVASVAFHIQHITGVIDRLFTYADGKQLTAEQLNYLENEGIDNGSSAIELIKALDEKIALAINKLGYVKPEELTEIRTFGRKKIASTLVGLYVHAAEHTMRHTGQLVVTIAVLKEQKS